MSVEQSDTIDALGVEVQSGRLVMTISDHLGWEETAKHLEFLRLKLSSYMRFVESGELLNAYPDAAGRRVVVDVVGRLEPNEAGQAFLRNAGSALSDAGLELRFRLYREPS